MEKFIELKNIFKSFGENKVLRGVNLSIHKKEVTAIIGKSGEGKSVLLKHIIGLLKPDEGEILINGNSIFNMTKKDTKLLKQRLSYMFQKNALFEHFTVFDNIALPLREKYNLSEKKIRKKVLNRIDQLDLKKYRR